MKCPECNGNSVVLETRPRPYGIRRRHKCLFCYYRFTTVEIKMSEYNSLINSLKDYRNLKEKLNNCLKRGAQE